MIREDFLDVLNFRDAKRLPIVNMGFWHEAMDKWLAEGHITQEEKDAVIRDGFRNDVIFRKLGFDFCFLCLFRPADEVWPVFPNDIVERLDDGFIVRRDNAGVLVKEKPGLSSIPSEVGHTLVDRASWEKEFIPRLRMTDDRYDKKMIEFYKSPESLEYPRINHTGSAYGYLRNWMGVVGVSMLQYDDPELFDEMLETVTELHCALVKRTYDLGARFDIGHFWEDICFKNGPLVAPEVFAEKCVPYYARVIEEHKKAGVELFSVDCDGDIDMLVPIWRDAGVSVMFPIEVGTWGGNLLDLRKKHGRDLRGVGGMDKRVFTADRTAIDHEIERLRPMVEDGGFIPCPDHLITPDAEWDLICYYTERMNKIFN